MKEIARSKRIKNVVSLQVARRRQPRGDSNRHVSKALLERLEAENAQLRDSVAELVLQIQALRAMHSAVRSPKFRACTHKSRLHMLVYATLSDPLATTHRARDLLVRGMRTKSAAVDRRVVVVTDRTTFTTSCADPPHYRAQWPPV